MSEKNKRGKGVFRCEISSRDLEIFKLINKYGYVKKSSFIMEFSESNLKFKNSHLSTRLKKLENYKYIKSNGHSYALDEKGIEELKLNGISLNYKTLPRGKDKIIRTYKDAALMINLDFKHKLSKIETINREKELGHDVTLIKNFCGTVWNTEDKKYLVYRVTNIPIFQLVRDMKLDIKNSLIKRIIVTIDNISQMKELKDKVQNLGVKEFLVIPNNSEGIEVLKLYNRGYFDNKHIKEYIEKSNKNIQLELEDNNLKINGQSTLNLTVLDLKKELNFRASSYIRKTSSAVVIFSDIYTDYFIEKSVFKLTEEEEKNGKKEIEQINVRISLEKFKSIMEIE
ncbi:hypothetical protein ACSW9V_15540 (plasmid) [Clostridium perfringens]|uniref:hypothetical protein n=1 Tax=Clostridium perfringens TaxID=1502 RepID=UPI000B39DE7D|nr:hypothetical protein [Clostridium perfringens]EGT0691175.1 hypothetical protein [Clostridium perfringens]EGT0694032.1 hypothetical protein [Clostridium perfringens]MDU3376300.1 hypothetical protein [Clostridium perfringens]MDU3535941.1 hypothetical protein [Clostridium perfringens]OUN51893.1 hypothetical protein B5G18_11620 [Clostridium perfringens]